jgi:hypothetical protein
MNSCPSELQLQQLLADLLSGVDHEMVEAHVEECASCQEKLGALAVDTGPPFSPQQAPQAQATEQLVEQEVLERLKQQPPVPAATMQ